MNAPTGCVSMIDISSENKEVDWAQVAASGIKRARIRLVRGNDGLDSMAATHVAGARTNNIDVEGYVACYPLPVVAGHPNRDPIGQAGLFVAAAKSFGVTKLFFDMEFPKLEDLMSHWEQTPEGVLTWLDAGLQAVNAEGLTVGIYGSPSYLVAIGCGTVPELANYELWVANYGVPAPSVPSPWKNWAAWQYSETGSVQGVTGNVDLSWCRS